MRYVHPHGKVLVSHKLEDIVLASSVRPHRKVFVRSVRPQGKVLMSHKLEVIILASSVCPSACKGTCEVCPSAWRVLVRFGLNLKPTSALIRHFNKAVFVITL